jgi:hypothetical protein
MLRTILERWLQLFRSLPGFPARVAKANQLVGLSGVGKVWQSYTMTNGDVHVIPLNDRYGHLLENECGCNPEFRVEGSGLVIVHNAWDHREIVEQAIRILNGEE